MCNVDYNRASAVFNVKVTDLVYFCLCYANLAISFQLYWRSNMPLHLLGCTTVQ